MKSRLLGAMYSFLFTFGMFASSHAVLVDRGGGLIYDDVLDITWLQDANYAVTSGYAAANQVEDTGGADTDNIFADGRMGWDAAQAWASGLSYFDSVRGVTYDDWRLPSTDVNGDGTVFFDVTVCSGGVPEPSCRDNEMRYHFVYNDVRSFTPGLFTNVQASNYWSGTESNMSFSEVWFVAMDFDVTDDRTKDYEFYAWAVRDGDVVPIPPALYLFGSGLIGLVGIARRKKAA